MFLSIDPLLKVVWGAILVIYRLVVKMLFASYNSEQLGSQKNKQTNQMTTNLLHSNTTCSTEFTLNWGHTGPLCPSPDETLEHNFFENPALADHRA